LAQAVLAPAFSGTGGRFAFSCRPPHVAAPAPVTKVTAPLWSGGGALVAT